MNQKVGPAVSFTLSLGILEAEISESVPVQRLSSHCNISYCTIDSLLQYFGCTLFNSTTVANMRSVDGI